MHHHESFPPPRRIVSVWQCTGHRRTGNSVCWDELACHLDVEHSKGLSMYSSSFIVY